MKVPMVTTRAMIQGLKIFAGVSAIGGRAGGGGSSGTFGSKRVAFAESEVSARATALSMSSAASGSTGGSRTDSSVILMTLRSLEGARRGQDAWVFVPGLC